jgi:Na+-driven multidrug efflux pump
MFLALCLGIITIAGGYLLLPHILDRMTITAEVRTIAVNYLGTMSVGFIPLYGSIILRSLVDTMGFHKIDHASGAAYFSGQYIF